MSESFAQRLGVVLVVLAIACACMASRIGRPVHPGELTDGVYEGKAKSFPNSARVRVTVLEGRIVDVELLRHGASSIGHRADEVIPALIVEKQSTKVDAVTGATNSSHVIMNAVEKALESAR